MHTKFQGHRPFGSREEDFLRFLPYMGMTAILVMWPGPFEQTYVPPSHRSSIWNLTLIGPVVSEEKMLKECGRRLTTTDDDDGRRTTEAYLSYKLTKWAFDSGGLKSALFSEKWHNLCAPSIFVLYIKYNTLILFSIFIVCLLKKKKNYFPYLTFAFSLLLLGQEMGLVTHLWLMSWIMAFSGMFWKEK